MTALRTGTPEYDSVFAGAKDVDGAFTPYPGSPTYADIANNFLNPANSNLLTQPDVVNAAQTADVRDSMRFIVRDLVADLGDGTPVNLPSTLLTGVAQLIQSTPIGTRLDDNTVTALFSAAASGDPKKIVGVVIGTALGTLSLSFPVVGLVAAVIVGITAGIVNLFNKHKAADRAADERTLALLYEQFPPMQVADSDFDGKVIQTQVRPFMRTRDWTRIFLPQFEGEWLGTERQGGYAFGQGVPVAGSDLLGRDVEVFVPILGLGVIPGSTSVTSVLQVSLTHDPSDPDSAAWLSFAEHNGPDPRSIVVNGVRPWERVKDTGMYLPLTGRVGGMLWDLATANAKTAKGLPPAERERMKVHGNALRYRIDMLALHRAWKTWAESGIAFIREKCYGWWQKFADGAGNIERGTDLEGFFGTAIFYTVGVWGGSVTGGTSTRPKYTAFKPPSGYLGPQISSLPKAYGWPKSSVSSSYSGAFLPILDPTEWPDELMQDRYSWGAGVSIKSTLDAARAAQDWELGNTLVAAYVSAADAAFVGDPKLTERLWKLRAVLLQHNDRFAIDMRDVGADELGVPDLPNSQSWREQLLAAGVPEVPRQELPGKLKLPGGGSKPSYCEAGIDCGKPEPEPQRPPFQPVPANPWEPGVIQPLGAKIVRPGGKSRGGGAAVGLAAAASLVVAGLVASAQARKQPSRSFAAGRLPRDLDPI